ncbi:unnamed protein product [Lactuca saligna]|uniref:Agenet domain-containing protein n=1 Tax=Lactuca saligna TaxID=75948 RepID=A0AA35VHN0_LACSI|nr:unnamed protein product [Lactuca saligna]
MPKYTTKRHTGATRIASTSQANFVFDKVAYIPQRTKKNRQQWRMKEATGTLLNDDGFAPLREIVTADQIRPLPPEVMATEFSLLDLVDAYDKDGWWVGKVIRKTGSNYLVYFEDSREEIVYPFKMLRIHQEWDGRVWVSSKK